jgi:hypothetical protein
MKNKKTVILAVSALIFLGIFFVVLLVIKKDSGSEITENKTETQEQIVGGDKDEHGCIGSAGYIFDEEIGGCIRDWELDENQKKAAKIGVEALGLKNPTIIEVLTARCPGCFAVTLEAGKSRIRLTLKDWLVVEQSMTPEECIDQGGRTVNIVGGSGCEAGEEQIGEVTGFISPNICCKVKK